MIFWKNCLRYLLPMEERRLTFHSGEDRLVKKSFKEFYKEGLYKEISKDVIRPSKEECNRNSRAKCTKMRWAIRA